jgi:peptidoglycan/LPS O-acetylase OafA/YrhL
VRCCAFLAVFIYHTLEVHAGSAERTHIPTWVTHAQATIARSGAYGVDLFFTLSAYLITELLLREKQELGSLDVKSFYVRRILRIWPLYYFFVTLAATIPFFSPGGSFSAPYVVSFLLMAGNWSTIRLGPPYSAALPLWSVSVEEQFYLLWPPLVARLTPRKIAFVALIMLAIANLTRVGVLLMHGVGWTVWANTLARMDPIAAGILLAVWLQGRAPDIKWPSRCVLIAGGAVCILTVGNFAVDWGYGLPWLGTLVSYPLVAAAAAAIMLGSIGIQLRLPTLEYLGKISYGLYVYHQVCIWLAESILSGSRGGVLHAVLREILALAITIAVAAASYAILEKPFLSLKNRFTYVRSRPT